MTVVDEPTLRISAFLGMFLLVALCERRWSWRAVTRARRWPANLSLLALDALLLRLAFPAAAVGFALLAASRGWGFLASVDLPTAVEWAIACLALDAAIWLQHLLFHRVSWLWPLHRVHHSDTGIDVTTGVRFHPLEILISMAVKAAVIVTLGAAAGAVLVFEVVLSSSSLLNHGNLRLPSRLEPLLRLVLVTPEMHRVHHSWHATEMNANYGFTLPWWDRLFGTYLPVSRDGADGQTTGLHEWRSTQDGGFVALLLHPFRQPANGVAG